jgi:imidazolonepropionase-like amidohydrolase
MSVAVASAAHLERELARARALGHDMIKSYVRMPDVRQQRIIEFAHSSGVPTSSHEIYSSALWGVDGVEHTTGTSRRGYSTKMTGSRGYADVPAIIGGAEMTFTPTLALSGAWLTRLISVEPSLRGDPRFGLMVPWARPMTGWRGTAAASDSAPVTPPALSQFNVGGQGDLILAVARAGGRVVAGTDTPNPANLHAELMAYVAAGMSTFDALRSATATPAAALAIDAGVIAPGKLADIVLVAGNPLERITSTVNVRWTIAHGRAYSVAELLRQP